MSTSDIAPPAATILAPPIAAPVVAASPAIPPPGVQPNEPVVAAPVVVAPPPPDAAAVAAKAAADALASPLQLKYPDGFNGDPAQLEAFKPLAKELGLTAEAAQKLVDFQAKSAQAQQAAFEQTRAKWVDTIKADPEIGGANLDKSVALAQRAVLKFGGAELQKEIRDAGLGDFPPLVRAFVRIGKAMAEDSVSGTTGAPAKDNSEEAFHRELFSNSPTMWGKR